MSLVTYSDSIPCAPTIDTDLLFFTKRLLEDPSSEIDDVDEFVTYLERSYIARIIFHNNTVTEKELKWPVSSRNLIPISSVALCIQKRLHACRLSTDERISKGPLAIYMNDDVSHEGDALYHVYSTELEDLRRAIRHYIPNAGAKTMADIIDILETSSPARFATHNSNLCPFANGILDRKTKVLRPYTENDLFTFKYAVNYNPNAPLPKIQQADGTFWSPDQLIPGFTADKDKARLLMQGIAAALRPFDSWNQMFLLFATDGMNGKGTYCALLRNLLGPSNTSGLNIVQTTQEFMLNGIEHKVAIIGDENPVGCYLDKGSALKSLISGDPLTMNVKFHAPVDFAFKGFIVQCVNDYPKARDRTGSWARRLVVIDFENTFRGKENKAIKNDYIRRKDVLEWFAKVAMDMEFDQFDTVPSCEWAKEDYLQYNDPIREFANEILPKYSWDLIPFTLAYEQYKNWLKQNVPQALAVGRNNFIHAFSELAIEHGKWVAPVRDGKFSSGGRMRGPEPTIHEYDVDTWINHAARVNDPIARSTPSQINPYYRGILRVPDDFDPNDPNRPADYEVYDRTITPITVDEFMESLAIPANALSTSVRPADDNGNNTTDKTEDTTDQNVIFLEHEDPADENTTKGRGDRSDDSPSGDA